MSLVWSFCLCTLVFSCIQATDYTGYKLIRFAADKNLAKWLSEMEGAGFDENEETESPRVLIDVWGEPSDQKAEADVLVAPEFYSSFTDILGAKGVKDIAVLKKDIQNDIRRERRDLARVSRLKRQIRSWKDFNEEDYHPYQDMVDFMKQLSAERSDLVTLLNISTSSENRVIYGVKIGPASSFKPAIFIDAGIHAREWVAPAAALYLIKKLVEGYGKDDKITKTLDKFDWYIVPQANPDGYEYSRHTDRLWRKTRSRNSTVNRWCVGADANRNWGYRWGEAGANRQPCSNIYAGSHPFSEPEITGLRDFLTWQIPQVIIYASLHSYGQLLLSPWGYTNQHTSNYLDQRNAARAAVTAIRNATGVNYNYGTISQLMYPASGTSIDYLQHRGVPYIYGIELRPLDTSDSYAFGMPPKYIKPTGEDMVAGLIAMGEYAILHKRL